MGGHGDSDDLSGAAQHAQQDAGSSGDPDLFSMALGMLSGKNKSHKNDEVDEEDAIQQHKKFYGDQQGDHQANSNNVGAAAAMQAMKMFNSGSQEDAKGGKNKFIGMAMSQAAQLFDKQQSQGKTVSFSTPRCDAIS
jgi:hypothetical protein